MVSKRRFSWRINPRVLAGFKELCRGEALRPSEVVEDFMRLALQLGSVSSVLDAASQGLASAQEGLRDQAEVLLQLRNRGEHWISMGGGVNISVKGTLFKLLGRIRDPALRQRIREALSEE